MDIKLRRDQWERRLRDASARLAALGADVEGPARARTGEAYTAQHASRDLPRPLPPLFEEVFSEGVAIHGSWRLPDSLEASLPEATSEVLWGEVDFSLAAVVEAELSRREWVETCFVNPRDPYDLVWHRKFAFHTVSNGDCLAVPDADGHGPVYYLSHDDGEGHGRILAESFLAFMEQWSRLAFAGPEDWLLLPFTEAGGTLDANGSAATAWRAALGLASLQPS